MPVWTGGVFNFVKAVYQKLTVSNIFDAYMI